MLHGEKTEDLIKTAQTQKFTNQSSKLIYFANERIELNLLKG